MLTVAEHEWVLRTIRHNGRDFISDEQAASNHVLLHGCEKMTNEGTMKKVEGGYELIGEGKHE